MNPEETGTVEANPFLTRQNRGLCAGEHTALAGTALWLYPALGRKWIPSSARALAGNHNADCFKKNDQVEEKGIIFDIVEIVLQLFR